MCICLGGCNRHFPVLQRPEIQTSIDAVSFLRPATELCEYISQKHFTFDYFINKAQYEAEFSSTVRLKANAVSILKGHKPEPPAVSTAFHMSVLSVLQSARIYKVDTQSQMLARALTVLLQKLITEPSKLSRCFL